ncbi:MAG: hypothetical protein A2W22_03995 [Candidatus Levybacteria bacterium RBG_16_35_11]|nr:MAG: hypothetical protein A2W22_03995 [Candidatus Levybacteria bacterium RBG_16_35_11]
MNKLPIVIGKSITFICRSLNLGQGSTWPGHIALLLNPNFIKDTLKKTETKIILVAGTNGKTTTGKLIKSILQESGKRVFLNQSGANLLNGIASAIISASELSGRLKRGYAIFEVDENTLPLILNQITPDYLIALNLFRDQLDRYGEIDKIARTWKKSFDNLTSSSTLVLNADDPLISFLSESTSAKVVFFGLNNDQFVTNDEQNAADSIYCLYCGSKLSYRKIFFSHLGDWSCTNCGHKRPVLNISESGKSFLSGTYNVYNVLASTLLSQVIGIKKTDVEKSIAAFKPAFGRQEIIRKGDKEVQIFLSKNPTSFNESLKTIQQLGGKNLLIVLNDRIPDGKDISWIWDTNIEFLSKGIKNISVSGDRAHEMALRMKYAGLENFLVEPNLEKAIEKTLISATGSLYILPTYSAMLEARKILTGRKIL